VETQNDLEQSSSALGSIEQSTKDRLEGQNSSLNSEVDRKRHFKKKMVKSATQQYLFMPKVDDLTKEQGDGEAKRQASTTDNLVDNYREMLAPHQAIEVSFISEKVVKVPIETVDKIDESYERSSSANGNAFDISFNAQTVETSNKTKTA